MRMGDGGDRLIRGRPPQQRMSFRATVGTPRLEGTTAWYRVVTVVDLRVYGGARTLVVERRYSEFADFHAALAAAAGRRLPPRPAKNPFAAFGPKARLRGRQ